MRIIPGWLALGLALVLVGCAGGTSPAQNEELEEIVILVDPSLTPSVASLPALGGSPRPIAMLEDGEGVRAAFVADELWIATDDRTAIDELLVRRSGSILLELDPAAAGVAGLPRQYLVRIDTSVVDPSHLSTDLRSLDPESRGSGRVSSESALRLIAAGAADAVAGLDVAINWIGSGAELSTQAIRDRVLDEAPTGENLESVAYSPNPFVWPTHDVGGAQDIGVAEAWRALDLAGKSQAGSVGVAILDMGFEIDSDTPAEFTAISNVPFVAPTGTENLLWCGDFDPCPWHGTNVMSAAFARVGNSFGSAGPGAPVAKPVLVYTSYDFYTSISALLEARALGAKIANMSYSVAVPSYLSYFLLPFEAATIALRTSGMLLFAAAGNDGDNVDAEQKIRGFGLGFESHWHAPCENGGVICVGGLFTNSLARHSGSNYGKEQVDIFAPFTLWLGPDPDAPENVARQKHGTSYSAPFTAGIAALVWASDSSLSASEVEAILMNTAKGSFDDKVGRVIDALAAVQTALGNVPPAVEVTRPKPGDEIHLNETVFFDAIVEDFEDGFGCCEVTWTSDLDGPIGTGRATSRSFDTVGDRVISLVAVDSDGGRTTVKVPITVFNDPPTVEITNPLPGDEVYVGIPIVFRATSFDYNEPGGTLACESMVWTSSKGGVDPFERSGCEFEAAFPSLGTRTITVVGTDPQGAADSYTVSVTVTDPPPDLPPSVLVTSPENFQSVQTDEEILLSGDVSDPEGATPVTLLWTVSVNGGTPVLVGTDSHVLWTPADTIDFSNEGTYDVTILLAAEDPGGNVGGDFVQLKFIIID